MKKLISLLTMIVITLTLTACFSQEPEAKEKKEPTLREKGEIYLIEELEKKYNKEFELVSMDSLFVSDSTSCVVRCIDDGIEFEARLHLRHYLEVESENYLCYKYLENVENDVIEYTKKYISDFKIVSLGFTHGYSYDDPVDITYEEFKEFLPCYSFKIMIPTNTELTDEEWDIIVEKFVSSDEYVDIEVDDYFREEIDLHIKFSIYKVYVDRYERLDFNMNGEEYRQLCNSIDKQERPDNWIRIL